MKKEDYVSYEVAKLLKSKGFIQKCNYVYRVTHKKIYLKDKHEECVHEVKLMYEHNSLNRIDAGYLGGDDYFRLFLWFPAPLLCDVQKWLRETHDIKVMPRFFEDKNNYGYDLYLGTEWDCTHSHIGSYEEALNEGIKQALKYI